MLNPDTDARRMLVREHHAGLSRDALAPAEPRSLAFRRIRCLHLSPVSHALSLIGRTRATLIRTKEES